MEIPQSARKAQEWEVSVRPDGGLNLAAQPDGIGDGECAELLNFWHDGRELTLRPGVCEGPAVGYGKVLDVFPRDGRRLLLKRIVKNGAVREEKYGVYIATERAVLSFDGSRVERLPAYLACEGGQWVRCYDDFAFGRCVLMPSGGMTLTGTDGAGAAWEAKGDGVFLFGTGLFLTLAPQLFVDDSHFPNVYMTADYCASYRLPYVPTVATGCTPAGAGAAGEARNFLTPAVSQSFTTDTASTVYHLYDAAIDDDTVTALYTPASGSALTFTLEAGVTTAKAGGITVTLDRGAGTLQFSAALAAAASLGLRNNLTVTYCKTVRARCPVFYCTAGAWFGGSAQGIYGGNRVFLAGDPERPNAVYYSAADDPSYFPENAVLTVGDPTDPIAAFGRQFDILAVLKQNSLYSVARDGSGDAFLVREVHQGCGCDMPGSVQLIDNALVWGNSAGGLCRLESTRIKDERAVQKISAPVDALLLGQDAGALCDASSIDTGEAYLLLVGSSAYLWRYASQGQTQQQKAFYYWQLPKALGCPFVFGGALYACCADDGLLYTFDPARGTDRIGGADCWFAAGMRSKRFDFGRCGTAKQLVNVTLRAQAQQDVPVAVVCYGARDETVEYRRIAPGGECLLRVRPPLVWETGIQAGLRRAEGETARFGLIGLTLRIREGGEMVDG